MKLRHRTRQYKLVTEKVPGYGVSVHRLSVRGHSERGPLNTTYGTDDIFMLGDTIIWRMPWK